MLYYSKVELKETRKEVKLVRIDVLREKMNSCGKTMTAIAKESGISRETLYNRLNGIGEFTVSEAAALTRVLQLSKRERDFIFLSQKLN